MPTPDEIKQSKNKHLEDKAAVFNELVKEISQDGASFKAFQQANKNYKKAHFKATESGAGAGRSAREDALYNVRLARAQYLAPMAHAMKQEGAILTEEDWFMLADEGGATGGSDGKTSVNQLYGPERTAAIEAFKEKEYGKYKDLFTDEGKKNLKMRIKHIAQKMADVLLVRENTDTVSKKSIFPLYLSLTDGLLFLGEGEMAYRVETLYIPLPSQLLNISVPVQKLWAQCASLGVGH